MTRTQRTRAARLERIIEYRRRLTEQAQQRLAEESHAVSVAEEALDRLQQRQRELAQNLERLARAVADPAVLETGDLYQRWMAQQVSEQARTLELARRREEAARDTLLFQQREKRKLEKVQERWQAESSREVRRQESLLLDEIALSRYHQNRQQEGASQ
ncbi:flagellar export protein FliJ [Thermomicrobiaceae bacterium CFH 74404]|uniref:Flagellar FliJ protein n=1 Tax=Thermalbibacter longus TaxID=2951981 RepID=A0AA42BAH6_9BACT|nr:flagellar export protein FliJ [Thermalbibacter longus]MCM8749717.1 flagellar export protein FliJ [Thermalbibacter longus]